MTRRSWKAVPVVFALAMAVAAAALGGGEAARACTPKFVNGAMRLCGPATGHLSVFGSYTFRNGTCKRTVGRGGAQLRPRARRAEARERDERGPCLPQDPDLRPAFEPDGRFGDRVARREALERLRPVVQGQRDRRHVRRQQARERRRARHRQLPLLRLSQATRAG